MAVTPAFKIKIPILMLGPYMRPFLYISMTIFAVLAVVMFLLAFILGRRKAALMDDLIKAGASMLFCAITLLILTVILHLFGMP